MFYRCPACGFRGVIRIPEHFPLDRKVRIRCSRCSQSFPLVPGRFWPQESEAAYTAILSATADCRGEKLGNLWVETRGKSSQSLPIVVLQGHPAFSHKLMHDLMEPFSAYTRLCYLEFPGTKKNPVRSGAPVPSRLLEEFSDSLEILMHRLGAPRIHLLSHMHTASLALQFAARRPEAVASLLLLEPELSQRRLIRKIHQEETSRLLDLEGKEKLLLLLFQDFWAAPLEGFHLKGLAKIMAPEFSPALLMDSLRHPVPRLPYRKLARIKAPALLFLSQDGGEDPRQDTLFLSSALPTSQLVELQQGGSWSAWLSGAKFSSRILPFLGGAEKGTHERRSPAESPAGQPLGLISLFALLLTVGLAVLLDFLPCQPPYMRKVLPPLLGGLLPILWFVAPRRMGLLPTLRFRGFTLKNLLAPLGIGLFLGLSWCSLLQGFGATADLQRLPGFLISQPTGSAGRGLSLAALASVLLLAYGLVENLLILRRSRLVIALPLLLFALMPPSAPDLLWRILLGLSAAFLFRESLSIWAPLALLTGFSAASQLSLRCLSLPALPFLGLNLQGTAGLLVSLLLLLPAAAGTILFSASRSAIPADIRYYFRRGRESSRRKWSLAAGLVGILFSLIASAVLVAGFISV